MNIEKLEKEIQKIIADKTLDNIKKKVAIADILSGKYKGKNGEITVYRSPNNRTLLAVKGIFNGENIHKIDLVPQKILGIIQNIVENKMIKLNSLIEDKETILYRINYKDGTDDYIKMTTAERSKMPFGNVKNVTGMKWGSIPAGRELVSYEEMRNKAKKKVGENKMKKSELRKIVREELLNEFFHPDDDLLKGITFQELIDTVYSNEKVVDEKSVWKVFNELVKVKLEDAKSELKSDIKQVIKEIEKARQ